MLGHVKWVTANELILHCDDDPNIVRNTKNEFDLSVWSVHQYQWIGGGRSAIIGATPPSFL